MTASPTHHPPPVLAEQQRARAEMEAYGFSQADIRDETERIARCPRITVYYADPEDYWRAVDDSFGPWLGMHRLEGPSDRGEGASNPDAIVVPFPGVLP